MTRESSALWGTMRRSQVSDHSRDLSEQVPWNGSKSAIWNATWRSLLVFIALIIVSFSLRVVIEQSYLGLGVVIARGKFPGL
jgi:hypothetical protein